MIASERLKAWIVAEALAVGWSINFARYMDERDGGNNTIILQQHSVGRGDVYQQVTPVELAFVGATPSDVQSTSAVANAIKRAASESDAGATGIVKLEPAGNVRGPFFYEDNRPVCYLTIEVFTEDL